jgi:hypothetical protein
LQPPGWTTPDPTKGHLLWGGYPTMLNVAGAADLQVVTSGASQVNRMTG